MIRTLKNISRLDVNTIFRGKKISLRKKCDITLDDEKEEDLALYRHLTNIYGFVIDRSDNINLKQNENKNTA